MMRKRWMIVLALTSALAVGALACGGDDDDPDGGGATPTRSPATAPAATSPTAAVTSAGTAAATAAATSAATAPAGGGTLEVTAADFSFTPAELTAPAGSVTVVLTNSGAAPHTFTLYSDGAFTDMVADTDRVSGSDSRQFTTELEAGTYFFRCQVHPGQMQGELTVE